MVYIDAGTNIVSSEPEQGCHYKLIESIKERERENVGGHNHDPETADRQEREREGKKTEREGRQSVISTVFAILLN